jgi:hypothetical protein
MTKPRVSAQRATLGTSPSSPSPQGAVSKELQAKIIEGRIRALEKQIAKQQGELDKVLELLQGMN